MARFFDTQAPQQFNASGLSGLVDRASASPLNAIGKTMSELDAIATERGKEQYSAQMSEKMKGITSTEDLLNIGYDRTRGTDALGEQFDTQATALANLEKLKQDAVQKPTANFRTEVDPISGRIVSFNQSTGKFGDVFENLGGTTINPKNIVMKPVVTTDKDGRTNTKYVPVDKTTGLIPTGLEGGGEPVTATKSPTLSQKDKDFLDNYGSLSEDFSNFAEVIDFDKNPDNKDIFGLSDALYDSTIGKLFETKDYETGAKVDAMAAGMMQKVVKQFGSNPSDIDMKKLEDQVPSRYDSPEVAKEKFKRFKQVYLDGQNKQLKRLRRSNPSAVREKVSEEAITRNLPDTITSENAKEFGITFN